MATRKKISANAILFVKHLNDDVCYVTSTGEQLVNHRAIKRLRVLLDVWGKVSERVKAMAEK